MTSRRLKEPDRRNSILEAATSVFAEGGLDRATTNKLAQAAGVSPALLYRHFPSKEALHHAVLQRIIEGQDVHQAIHGTLEPSTKGIFAMLARFMTLCVRPPSSANAKRGARLLLASLIGDSEFARIVLNRAAELNRQPLRAALLAAEVAGDLQSERFIHPDNAVWFLYGVGQTIVQAKLSGRSAIPYKGDAASLERQAVIFCARGLGFSDEAIQKHYLLNTLISGPRPTTLRRTSKTLESARKSA